MSGLTITPHLSTAIDRDLLVRALIAGAFATLAFDLFGQTLSPLLGTIASPLFGAKLAPVPLANAMLSTVFGLSGETVAGFGLGYAVHTVTGLIVYPLAYALVVLPLARSLSFAGARWLAAVAYGIALWVFALYFMAHLVAGNPPFLGWGGLTWVALWGHVLYALVIAAVLEATAGEGVALPRRR